MKNLSVLILVAIASLSSLKVTAQHQGSQDTMFIKNYIAANKTAYLYAKPDSASKTKIRIPQNVMITTIQRSGKFEYGDFSVSSTKTFKGWFLISDLKGMMLTPPKDN